ncbi:MAG: gluconokinase [Gemmatimonadaceae bacterium]
MTSDTSDSPCALAVDVGTSSVRVFLYDRLLRNLGGSQLPYVWSTTPDGGVEIAADLVVDHAIAAVDRALAGDFTRPSAVPSAGDPSDANPPDATMPRAARTIAAVGVSAFWHTLVGVGADGAAVTPIYAWSDTRAARAAAVLRERLDERAIHARTGAVLHPSYLPARLLWLRESLPDLHRAVRWWMSAPEYLGLRLFGERRVSVSMASATGLFDQHRQTWDDEMLGAIDLSPDALSPIADVDAPCAPLRAGFAARWPALRGVPWLPAAGDGACANLGSGCVTPDRVALSLGTSGALRVMARADRVEIPPGLWCYRLDRERPLLGGAISNGGSVYRWAASMFQLPPAAELEAALEVLAPDAHGLTMLPFLAGERSPDWPPAARAAIAGITLHTTPVQIVQAALEAVAYRLALIRAPLAAHFPSARTVVASGGAIANSRAWARIIADVFGEPLLVARDEEASSRGAAMLAFALAGIPSEPPARLPSSELIEPDPARHARYAEALERHRSLDAMLTPLPPRS